MKTALILTYDFPPCSAPGAATRSLKLVKYLPEFGWDARVICRDEGISAAAGEPSEAPHQPIRVRTPTPPRISYQLGAWMWGTEFSPVRVR